MTGWKPIPRQNHGLTDRRGVPRPAASETAEPLVSKGFCREAPVGVEPTMTDLQSVALATWLRSRLSLDRLTRHFELSLPNRDNQNCRDRWISCPIPQVGRIVVVELEAVNRVVWTGCRVVWTGRKVVGHGKPVRRRGLEFARGFDDGGGSHVWRLSCHGSVSRADGHTARERTRVLEQDRGSRKLHG